VSLSALTPTLDQALAIYADVIRNPAYRQADVDRVKAQQAAGIRAQRLQPAAIATRVMASIIYGPNHPLGRQATEASVASITRDDLVAFHRRWIKPDNGVLLVVGDTTLKQMTPKLEAALGAWKASSPTPRITVPAPSARTTPVAYLVDRPGSPQSYVLAGLPAAPRTTDTEFNITAFNTNFGGNFTSRINMNLREDKGYTYGAFCFGTNAMGQGCYVARTQVRTDVTKESLSELMKEIRDIRGKRPVTAEELKEAQTNIIRSLPGDFDTNGEVAGKINDLVLYSLPEDFYSKYAERVQATTSQQLTSLAEKRILPDQEVIIVVGDKSKVEAGLRELNLGPIEYLDADGRPVAMSASAR
jgi:zinc protease